MPTSRKVIFKPNEFIEPCPNCGNNTEFTINSDYCAEDCCEIWAVCKCGYDPTQENTDCRVEDVWGGVEDDNCKDAIRFSWNEPIQEKLKNKIEKKYYIISLKHTSVGDSAFTFWGKDFAGYTWHKDRAGLYMESDKSKTQADDNVFVEKSLVDALCKEGNDYEDKFISLPNTFEVQSALLLNPKFMKPKRNSTCRIKF